MRRVPWALALLGLGCRAPTSTTTDGEPAVSTLALGLNAVPSTTMPTTLHVSWHSDKPSTARLLYGVDGLLDRATALETAPSVDHQATLVGLPQNAPVEIAVEVDGQRGPIATFDTGEIPGAPADPLVVGEGNDTFLALPILGEASNDIVVYDRAGRVSYFVPDDRGLSVFRVRPSVDGTGLWFGSVIVAGGPSPDSTLVHVTWDGVVDREWPAPDLAHDFVETPDGRLVALSYETRDGVLGNALVEVDATGVTPLWSTWDCFDPVTHPGDDPTHGWTHANALDLDPDTGLYLVGMRNLGTIAAVDLDAGTCPWAFGGTGGTVTISGEPFWHQHQFEWSDGHLAVFDNDGAPGSVSRILDHAFDPDAGTAQVTEALVSDPPRFSFILGDVHRPHPGELLVTWSVPQVIERYDAARAVVWTLDGGGTGQFGFATASQDLVAAP